MKFLCGSCRTKYQISDEKVRGKILTIRCKKCGAKILVRESLMREAADGPVIAPLADTPEPVPRAGGSAVSTPLYDQLPDRVLQEEVDDMPTSIAPVPADAGLAGFEWYVAIDAQQHGPFAFAELVHKVRDGSVQGRHHVWHDGMADWTRVRDLPDLASYLPQTAPPPPAPGAAVSERPLSVVPPTPLDAPSDGENGATEVEAVVAEPPPEPKAEPPRASPNVLMAAPADDLGLDDDDIFANIPRASEQELVQRESTKFFVAAAGVQNQKKKNRLGVYLGAAAAALLVGVVGLGYAGVIQITLPGVGNPFGAGGKRAVAEDDDGPFDDDVDFAILVAEEKPEPSRPRARPRRAPSSPGRPVAGLGDGFIEEEEDEAGRARSRGPGEAESVTIQGFDGRLAIGSGPVSAVGGPDSDPRVPTPDGKDLEVGAVKQVLSSNAGAFKRCYDQSVRRGDGLSGKLSVRISILPTGRVGDIELAPPKFRGGALGECVVESTRRLRFPSFEGDPMPFEFPIVFQGSG